MLLEVCETGSPTQANDSLKLFAICTSLYQRAVVPFMGRALKVIVKRIKASPSLSFSLASRRDFHTHAHRLPVAHTCAQ